MIVQSLTKGIVTLILSLAIAPCLGQSPESSTHYLSSSESIPASEAFEFAKQAGMIAGVVQACGQNILPFNQRVQEALSLLATNPSEAKLASILFQNITREARQLEEKEKPIPCAQALKSYQNLPILGDHYQTTVLSKLKADQKEIVGHPKSI